MSASSSTDPSNWVTNPPSTFVKVQNTSREDMNGKLGLVLQYTGSRYTLLMCLSQDQVSLKPTNLVVCSTMEKATAYYQMLTHNPQIRQQVLQIKNQVEQTIGLKWEYVAVLVLVLLTVGSYFIGLARVLLILSSLIVLGIIVGPDRTLVAVRRNAPGRWKSMVRNNVPMGLGPTIADNSLYLQAFTAFMIVVIVYAIVGGGGRRTVAPVSPPLEFAKSSSSIINHLDRESIYKLGFDDATAGREFGTSLPEPQQLPPPPEDDDYAWRDVPPPKKKASPYSLSTLLSIFTIYRTIIPLCRGADGQVNLALLRQNLVTLEPWKLGILAFAVYRLVAAFVL